jgi:hypothetical protein
MPNRGAKRNVRAARRSGASPDGQLRGRFVIELPFGAPRGLVGLNAPAAGWPQRRDHHRTRAPPPREKRYTTSAASNPAAWNSEYQEVAPATGCEVEAEGEREHRGERGGPAAAPGASPTAPATKPATRC